MRKFSYFYYDNFVPEDVRCPADDPRTVLNENADIILTEIVESVPGSCNYSRLCTQYSETLVDNLIHVGLLRREGEVVLLDTPVFVHEDADWLHNCFSGRISKMMEALVARKDQFFDLARDVHNGFPTEVNLYHLFCGAVFDGEFFDFLSRRGVVATSRVHPSGLDYLVIAYERSPALDDLSNKLLCSYNRFSDGTRSLQSFGDADGDRVDFFRFSRQKQLEKIPAALKWIEFLWTSKEEILAQAQSLVETGTCEENCYQLFEAFGYLRDGQVSVPVYREEHLLIISRLEQFAEACLGDEMASTLNDIKVTAGLVCSQHGVAAGEIANELYHVVFGQLNEALAAAGLVAMPPKFPGQGRYFKSIELY